MQKPLIFVRFNLELILYAPAGTYKLFFPLVFIYKIAALNAAVSSVTPSPLAPKSLTLTNSDSLLLTVLNTEPDPPLIKPINDDPELLASSDFVTG